MMRRMALLLLGVCILLAPALANADDILPAPWRGGVNSIYSIWDDWTAYVPGAQVVAPDNGGTPIGTPLVAAGNTNMLGPTAGVMAFDTPNPGPYILLDIPNYPNLQQVKQIRVQITFEPNYNNAEVSWVVPSFREPTQWFWDWVDLTPNPVQVPGGLYKAFDIFIFPNPFKEEIALDFFGDCIIRVDQIVLDTQCVPVPGTALLLASGLVGVIGLRRKFFS